jgi:hypothetical protein
VDVKDLEMGQWADATVDFNGDPAKKNGPTLASGFADEVHFLIPANAELLVDDLLLYEPGKK